MGIKLSQIAKLVNGTLAGEDIEVIGVSSLHSAKDGHITFLFTKKFLKMAQSSSASAFIISEGITLEGKNTITVKNPPLAQAIVLNYFFPIQKTKPYVSEKAFVSPNAKVSEDAVVMDFAYISDEADIESGSVIYPFVYIGKKVRVGKNSIIYPHAVILDDTLIGENVIVYAGAILGSDGFGYAFNGKEYVNIPQMGKVVLSDNVEVGANTTIDRATLDETFVGKGTKIDNLVMIGHNVSIGENCILVGQVGVAGSSSIGNRVIMGGQVGIGDHVVVEDDVMIAAQSGVTGHVTKGSKIAGSIAVDFKKWLKIQAILNELPEMKKKLDELLKRSYKDD